MQFSRHLIEQTEHVLADARIYQREFPGGRYLFIKNFIPITRARARTFAHEGDK